RLLRVDLRAEARKLEAEAGAGVADEAAAASAYRPWDVRAFRVGEAQAGRTAADLERAFLPARVFVERIRRGTAPASLEAGTPGAVLRAGDVVALGGRREVFPAVARALGADVEDRELLDFPATALDVVVTRAEVAERTLAEVAAEHGRGVTLLSLTRAG